MVPYSPTGHRKEAGGQASSEAAPAGHTQLVDHLIQSFALTASEVLNRQHNI